MLSAYECVKCRQYILMKPIGHLIDIMQKFGHDVAPHVLQQLGHVYFTCTVKSLYKDTPKMTTSPLIRTLCMVPVIYRSAQNYP